MAAQRQSCVDEDSDPLLLPKARLSARKCRPPLFAFGARKRCGTTGEPPPSAAYPPPPAFPSHRFSPPAPVSPCLPVRLPANRSSPSHVDFTGSRNRGSASPTSSSVKFERPLLHGAQVTSML